ncbi:RNA-guided pseudouridylation complex pseudouridine synthase subunit Cbf5 [Sulfuracidifex metallicus]|jgi:H/ACA ribonucleoprotein complex subunit 4|nr:RNA-guided pseudouridylation complex pseudouridine synthase subunit Cbf5 [Sulfuracidifex metallicus]WOE51191.1 RNA-guided pseudouridylation complex pseudouridine synthase subunit Cbf5 [Sulfuracidifex metallicus DSM 6482 = JCM 9184]
MHYVSRSTKEYVCVMQVHSDFEKESLKSWIMKFKGKIYQRPPVRSSVSRKLRTRKIYDIEVTEIEDRLVLMKVISEHGTYMRKLCHDIGILSGYGAHMRELRRTRTGIFDERNLVTMHEFSEAVYMWKNCKDESFIRKIIMPMEIATCGIPKIMVDNNAVSAIAYGAKLTAPGVVGFQQFKKDDVVCVITTKGELVSVGKALMDYRRLAKVDKGEVASTDRVFIDRDVYPKHWGDKDGGSS